MLNDQCKKLDNIVPGIWLTCYITAYDKKLLLSNGITHIVNASPWENPHEETFKYLRIKIEDDDLAPIEKYFGKVSRFICNALCKGGNVLVYCAAGISRSPTLVMAFLIHKRRMIFEEAYSLCIKHRQCVDPNRGFIKKLKGYQLLVQKRRMDKQSLQYEQ